MRPSLALLVLLSAGGCAYYNGLYNARGLVKRAESASREGRDSAAVLAWREAAAKADKAEAKADKAEVKAEKTNCDPNPANATTRETSGVAATVLRSVEASKLPQPQLTLYGASPLVEAKGRGKLVIRRLDVPGERQEINLGGTQLKGRFLDFAGENVALVPGGLYAATFKSSQIVFRVDAQAKPGATPVVGRLLRME